MRLIPSDPDLQTLFARIKTGDIELQPNFQRGEVWSKQKNQRLIDSILRDWHIPPIHVIENRTTGLLEVLDGQQRLAAIRDFMDDRFAVDGFIEPANREIEQLDGLRFSQLTDSWQRRINQFAIRVFRVVEYEPGEPWELFFRLNQSTRLTGAEERNAFFGPVRDQIKSAVARLEKSSHLGPQILGFSNARMAYDDLISRTALAIQRKTLAEKITSADLTDLYRREEPLARNTMARLEYALDQLHVFSRIGPRELRLNKASVFSWLMFIVRANWERPDNLRERDLSDFVSFFWSVRDRAAHLRDTELHFENVNVGWLLHIFEDRSTSRVADTSSVLLRDAVLWIIYLRFARSESRPLPLSDARADPFRQVAEAVKGYEPDVLLSMLLDIHWGDLP